MSTHLASGQMIGYLYQVRYALFLLLSSKDVSRQISIEKFDDISFDDDGEPKELIQLKHHMTPGSLSNTSTDLWRTLNSWIDSIKTDISLLESTDFIIITTATIPTDSAAEALNNKNAKRAHQMLTEVAKKHDNKSHVPYYKKYLALDESIAVQLLERVVIISNSSDIQDVGEDIANTIKYSCKPNHIAYVTERLEGWWFKECVKALCSGNPVIMCQAQLHNKTVEIAKQYGDDNLPVEFWEVDDVGENTLNPSDRIFLDQLRLLKFQDKFLRLALCDYYRAFKQRSQWLRQGLVYVNELDSYESRLKDAWEHAFERMRDDLNLYGEPNEDDKVVAGRKLYQELSDKDIRIRPQCCASYIMNGTYHKLANSLMLGWHIDFLDRLQEIIGRS